MTFVELFPTRSRNRANSFEDDKAKVYLISKSEDKTAVKIYIGKIILTKLGWSEGTKIRFFVDDYNPLIWKLEKSQTEKGWTLYGSKRKAHGPFLMIQLTWKHPGFKIPERCLGGSKFVKEDFYQGGLRLALPGVPKEDLLF